MANRSENNGKRDFVFLGFKSMRTVTAGMQSKDACFLLGRKAMKNLGSICKRRDISLPTDRAKAMVFPVVIWELDHKEGWVPKNWCFQTLVLEKTQESLGLQGDQTSPSLVWRNQEISPEYSMEGLMLKLKLQYLATWCEELTHWKRPWCWERLKAGGEGDGRGWDG